MNNDSPKISVVIPLYNKVRHIKRALDSVLAQTFQDFEVIVVNDGSTDGSEEVVRQYTDLRMQLINQANTGVSAARNRGVEEVHTDLIAFLDADDEWMPEHLKTILRLVEKYPECGAYVTAYEVVITQHRRKTPKFKGIPKSPWEGIIPNYFRSASGSLPVCSSAVAVWKRVFKDVGEFPVRIQRGEDLDMWGRIALKYSIAFSNNVSALYRTDATNRICITEPDPLGDNALDRTLKNAIETGNFRNDLCTDDLLEMLNWRNLNRARTSISDGEKMDAWSYMKKVTLTRKSIKLLLKNCILIIIPHRVLILTKTIKDLIWKQAF